MSVIISIDNGRLQYGQRILLDNMYLQVYAGECIGICGRVGSGKSTLLRSFIGLQSLSHGTLNILDMNPANARTLAVLRRKCGYLFQDSDDQLFCATVAEDVAFGLLNQGMKTESAREHVAKMLSILGLEGYQERIIHHLSGGEKRLVALATILVMNPEILLLDEPFSSLDAEATNRVVSVLKSWPGTVLLVSHDRADHSGLIDRWYSIEAGRLVSHENTDQDG